MGPIQDPYYSQLYRTYKTSTDVVIAWLSKAGDYKDNVLSEFPGVARRLAQQGVLMPPHVLHALAENIEAREEANRWHQATGSDDTRHKQPVVVFKAILAAFTTPLVGPAPSTNCPATRPRQRASSLPSGASQSTSPVAYQKDTESNPMGRGSQSDSELEWRRSGLQQQQRQQQQRQHQHQHQQRQQQRQQRQRELQQQWRPKPQQDPQPDLQQPRQAVHNPSPASGLARPYGSSRSMLPTSCQGGSIPPPRAEITWASIVKS